MADESIERLDSTDTLFDKKMVDLEGKSEKNVIALDTGVDPTGRLQGILCGFDVWQNELQREMSATEASDRELAGYRRPILFP
jgi:hypothetical protein